MSKTSFCGSSPESSRPGTLRFPLELYCRLAFIESSPVRVGTTATPPPPGRNSLPSEMSSPTNLMTVARIFKVGNRSRLNIKWQFLRKRNSLVTVETTRDGWPVAVLVERSRKDNIPGIFPDISDLRNFLLCRSVLKYATEYPGYMDLLIRDTGVSVRDRLFWTGRSTHVTHRSPTRLPNSDLTFTRRLPTHLLARMLPVRRESPAHQVNNKKSVTSAVSDCHQPSYTPTQNVSGTGESHQTR